MATPGTFSPEALNYYAQMGIPVPQQQPPDLSNYAQQPMQQATPMQVMPQEQALRTSPDRQAYFQAVEQRFQELANQVGGINNLVKYNAVEYARNRALKDIQQIYGEPPAIERPPQVMNVQGVDYAVINGKPVEIPSATKRQAEEVELKKAQVELTQAEKEARDKQFERVSKLETGWKQFDEGIRIIDQLLSDPRLQKNVGGNAFFAALPATEARAIAGMINQIKGQNFLNAYESLRGASGISNIEGQKAEQAMGRIDQYLEEKDLRQALEELRNRYDYARQKAQLGLQYFGASEDKQAQPPATQMAPSPSAPAAPAQPMKVQSPGAPKVVRDPTTRRLIRQQ